MIPSKDPTPAVMAPETHPDVDLLGRFVSGRLDKDRSAALESHVENCSCCCDTLARLSSQSDALVRHLVEAAELNCHDPSTSIRAGDDIAPGGSSTVSVPFDATPRRIGRFEIHRKLGEGGFGVVLLAYDPKLRRDVALKVPRAGVMLSTEMRRRFQREAQASGALDHPYIVPVYETGEDGEVCYIASAYCRGCNLADWLKARDEPVEIATAARFVQCLALGVAHAHGRGVLHRDLKPSNILLEAKRDDEGAVSDASRLVPRITDFGLARLDGSDPEATRSHVVMGTASYMSPEQARGRTLEITRASDIYSLGAILYELLTGRPPLVGDSDVETLQRVHREEPIPPARLRPRLPRDLETICLTCLQKDPHRRYSSAAALAEDLQRFLDGVPIRATRSGRLARVWRWSRRNPLTAGLTGLVATLLVVVVTGSLIFGYEQRQLWRVAEDARNDEHRQRKLLEQMLEDQHVRRALEQRQDPAAALVSLVQALRLGADDPARAHMHRLRIASQLQRAAGWRRMWLHEGAVIDAEFDPDGQRIVTCSADGVAQVWDTSTGLAVTEPLAHNGDVVCGRFSPSGKFLVTACRAGYAQIWDVESGEPRGDPLQHDALLTSARFTIDGNQVISADENCCVCVWDVGSGRLVKRTEDHGGNSIALSNDGRWMAASGRVDGLVWIWDLRAMKPRFRIRHGERVKAVAFSPSGDTVATAAGSHVALWSVSDEQCQHQRTLTNKNLVKDIRFDATGRRMIAACVNAEARVWRWQEDGDAARLEHSAPVAHAAFGTDGTIITAAEDGSLRVWDPHGDNAWTATVLHHAGAIRSLQVSPDGQLILTGGDDRTARLWRVDRSHGERLAKHNGIAYDVCYSPDGQQVLSVGFDHAALLIDRTTGRARRLTHQAPVRVGEFSPDGRHLLTAGNDGRAILWDRRSAEPRIVMEHGNWASVYAEFNSDGSEVVTVCGDHHARRWSTEGGKELATATSRYKLELARFLPDGERLVLAGYHPLLWDGASGQIDRAWFSVCRNFRDREIVFDDAGARMAVIGGSSVDVHDARTGELLVSGFRHEALVRSVCFSPDGSLLATAGTDQTARVWDSRTARPITGELRHPGDVLCVTFSPDGRLIATSTVAACAFLWDARTGDMVDRMPRYDSVWDVCFDPAGEELVVVDGQGNVVAYPVRPDCRPVDRLQKLVELVSGKELRADGRIIPLSGEDFAARMRSFCQLSGDLPALIPDAWHLQ